MPKLMIRCPKTGEPVATGVAVDSLETLKSFSGSNNQVACPHCGVAHTWNDAGAFLAD